MSRDLWRRIGNHPIYVLFGFLGSVCSIASFVLSLTGTVPAVVALAGVLILSVVVVMAYRVFRPDYVENPGVAASTERPTASVATLGHYSNLRPQDFLCFLQGPPCKDAAIYREATELLRAGKLVQSDHITMVQAVGNAIDGWVALGHRLLHEGYPGTVLGSQKKEDTLNRLHRAAYKRMYKGTVIDFAGDDSLREWCLAIVKVVERWVDGELVKRP